VTASAILRGLHPDFAEIRDRVNWLPVATNVGNAQTLKVAGSIALENQGVTLVMPDTALHAAITKPRIRVRPEVSRDT
jgi:hypothetical protein